MDHLIDVRPGAGQPMLGGARAGGGEIVWFERRAAVPGFTARDRSELARWASDTGQTVILEEGPAGFAMLYRGATSWASWAVARQDGQLVVWNCVTFADIGWFGSMVDALATLSGSDPDDEAATSNVLSFCSARRRRVGSEWDRVQPV